MCEYSFISKYYEYRFVVCLITKTSSCKKKHYNFLARTILSNKSNSRSKEGQKDSDEQGTRSHYIYISITFDVGRSNKLVEAKDDFFV